MFFQSSETEPIKSLQKQKPTRKKRKKQKHKNKKKGALKGTVKPNIPSTVCSWAENFTMAATWQLKHQVAMWKSKATALEYENHVLRETLRNLYVDYETSYTDSDVNSRGRQNNSPFRPPNNENYESSDDSEDGSELELEISEEYMAFLKQNFLYRKAREERKKKEAEERKKETEVAMDVEAPVDRTEEFKHLYGDDWQKVLALDSYLLSQFISVSDTVKPKYWPNIPLRF